jgi:hypothetical protein
MKPQCGEASMAPKVDANFARVTFQSMNPQEIYAVHRSISHRVTSMTLGLI